MSNITIEINKREFLIACEDGKEKEVLEPLLLAALKDSSYWVVTEALGQLSSLDLEKANVNAQLFMNEKNTDILIAIANIFGKKGEKERHSFFTDKFDLFESFHKARFMNSYNEYLGNVNDFEIYKKAEIVVKEMIQKNDGYYSKYISAQIVNTLVEAYKRQIDMLEKDSYCVLVPLDYKLLYVDIWKCFCIT